MQLGAAPVPRFISGPDAISASAARTHATKGERLVAVFEAAKGVIVLLVGFGLLAAIHQDVQSVAAELVHTFHLNPAMRYPRIFLEAAERYSDVRLWLLGALALGYAAMRLAEAYGLWFGRRWAEWFAVLSGGFYVVLEIDAVWHRVSWVRVGALVVNVAIVAYLGLALWWRRRDRAPSHSDSFRTGRGGPSAYDRPTPRLRRSAQT